MTTRNDSSNEITPTNISKNLIKCNMFQRRVSTNKNTQKEKSGMQKKLQEVQVFKPEFNEEKITLKHFNNKPFFRLKKHKK